MWGGFHQNPLSALFAHLSVWVFSHPGSLARVLAWERSECNLFPSLCPLGGCQAVENNCFQGPDYASIYSVSNQRNLQPCCGSFNRHLCFSYHLNLLLQLLSDSKKKKKASFWTCSFPPKPQRQDKEIQTCTSQPELLRQEMEMKHEHGLLLCTIIIFPYSIVPVYSHSTALALGRASAVLQHNLLLQGKLSMLPQADSVWSAWALGAEVWGWPHTQQSLLVNRSQDTSNSQ